MNDQRLSGREGVSDAREPHRRTRERARRNLTCWSSGMALLLMLCLLLAACSGHSIAHREGRY